MGWLAGVAVAAVQRALVADHDVSGAHDAAWQRVTAVVHSVVAEAAECGLAADLPDGGAHDAVRQGVTAVVIDVELDW
jgi:hypothetical protein